MTYVPSLEILGNRDVKSSNEMGDVPLWGEDVLSPGSPEGWQLIYRVYVQSFRFWNYDWAIYISRYALARACKMYDVVRWERHKVSHHIDSGTTVDP
jgi:hypothetical protein